MEGFLKLNRGVNTGEEEDERDVIATKSALQESGDYSPPGGHMSGWRDSETEQGLKTVQVRNNLWPDGRMRVDGPTHRIINAEKNERQTGSVPKSLGLTGSVGRHTSNNPVDVQKWRSNLGSLGYLDKAEADRPGGLFDNQLEWATTRFQTDYNRTPDGLVTPGGETESIMARVAAPMRQRGGRKDSQTTSTQSRANASSGQPGTKQSAKPWYERAGESIVETVENYRKSQSANLGAQAGLALRGLAHASEAKGYEHAPRRLRHFLDGSGMDQEIDRDKAREREPVKIGEPENRRKIESALTATYDSEGGARKGGIGLELLSLKDGQSMKVGQYSQKQFRTGFNSRTSPHRTSEDERLATGRTTFISTIPDDLTAVRQGEIVTVYGTVEHRWDDRYDFKRQNDPKTGGGDLANLAVTARDFGTAKEYNTYAHWRQGIRAQYRVVNGELLPVDIQWTDHPQEADLR